jgi:type I restriction enzyme S subunit
MNAVQLLAHFDRISEALDAIPRLRRFIADLAVRGKLVEQDPNDQPASELLMRIQKEKARLVKAGKLKESRPMTAIDRTKAPYEIPANWEWVPLGETVNSHLGGGTPSKNISTYWNGDIFWASVKDVGKGKYVDETVDRITNAGLADSSSNLIPPGNLIIVTRMGLGKVSINRVPIAINQDLRALSLSSLCAIDYHYIFFRTHGFVGTGLTVKGIKVEELLNIAFPLPPLAEQHRIVAKVDELMELCDRLEAAQVDRESRRDRLVAASLHHFNNGRDNDEFREHARFYFKHLPRLTTRIEHIQQLRQTILNLAVRGKLICHDPVDEPVSELLNRLGAKTASSEPFAIPNSWEWVSVDQTGTARLGKMLDKGKNKGRPQRYLRNVNVRWFDFDLSNLLEMRFEDDELEEFALHRNDVLICEGGEPGRAAVWDEREKPIYFQKAIHRVRFPAGVDPHFFVYTLRESADSGRLAGYFTGVGIKHFTGKGLDSFVFPLAPLAEQHRLVNKVNELMALCARLEAQLTTTQAGSRRLLEATLHHALSA